ncbi:hypothetical protein B5807_08401 [Epicoccum nigrum]|uniref:Uncharacterized protein n=1 Tax=Epicoccum nigrum TaxID=105696 RepID=A0A1Y2LRN8_EPING|nr:hypothetical protein B5807_08401 [Epicoccum nigrum]
MYTTAFNPCTASFTPCASLGSSYTTWLDQSHTPPNAPLAHLPHRTLIALREFRVLQHTRKTLPTVSPATPTQQLVLVQLAIATIQAALRPILLEDVTPDLGCYRAVKEIGVVGRAISKEVAEEALPRGACGLGYAGVFVVHFVVDFGGVEVGLHGEGGVVGLVEHAEQDLALQFSVLVAVVDCYTVLEGFLGERGVGLPVTCVQAKDLGAECEVFHQNGGKFGNVGRATSARDVLKSSTAEDGVQGVAHLVEESSHVVNVQARWSSSGNWFVKVADQRYCGELKVAIPFCVVRYRHAICRSFYGRVKAMPHVRHLCDL